MKRAPFLAAIILAGPAFIAASAGFAGQYGGNPYGTQQYGTTDIAGGRGGSDFSDPQPQAGARVVEVQIRAGDHIDAVQMLFQFSDGRTAMSPRHGGSGGRTEVFRLDPDEYITGISGRSGDYIDSLRIHTNKRASQLFGGRGGNRDYRIDVPPGNMGVGFIGRAGDYVDAVGLVYTTVRGVGPAQGTMAGGGGGSPFTDAEPQAGARISEIRVRAGDMIDSVQIVYALPDGRTYEGPVRGGRGGRLSVFILDPDEYVTGISGRSGDRVDSLRIHTNKRTSPLYGGGRGNREYRFDAPPGSQVVGFTGRSARMIDAIGLVYSQQSQAPWRGTRRRPF